MSLKRPVREVSLPPHIPPQPRPTLTFQAQSPPLRLDVPRCIEAGQPGVRLSPPSGLGTPVPHGDARGSKAAVWVHGGEFLQPRGGILDGLGRAAPGWDTASISIPCRSHPSGFSFCFESNLSKPAQRGSPASGEAEGFLSPSPQASPISTTNRGELSCTGARQKPLTPAWVLSRNFN